MYFIFNYQLQVEVLVTVLHHLHVRYLYCILHNPVKRSVLQDFDFRQLTQYE